MPTGDEASRSGGCNRRAIVELVQVVYGSGHGENRACHFSEGHSLEVINSEKKAVH